MRRPQFSLKSLLWLMAVVAAFFAGAEWGIKRSLHYANVERALLRKQIENGREREIELRGVLFDNGIFRPEMDRRPPRLVEQK
jgi:hypothetical protein